MADTCLSGPLPTLPMELITLIADNLSLSDIIKLLRVSRSFWALLVSTVNHAALLPRYRKVAFIWAVQTRNKVLLSLLIEKGRNFTVKRSDTGIMILKPPTDPTYINLLIRNLLELGSSIIVQDTFDLCTPLHEAARLGHTQALELMLDMGTELEIQDFRGWTPLLHAIWEGRLDSAKTLVKRGCNINATENHGMTPLHLAAIQGDPDIVQFLLQSGADCNIDDVRGWTAIEMREYTHGGSDAISTMILKGLKPNYLSSLDQTALHIAVVLQDLEMAIHFLDQGIDIDHADILGCTPLHDAAASGQKDMVGLLLSRGAEVDKMDSSGKTPLHQSLVHWPKNINSIAWALLDSGADVRLRDYEGNSVFDNMITLEVFQTQRDKMLLQRLLEGMEIEFVSKHGGGTLLNIAVEFGNEDCVLVLLDKGADINDFNQLGMTALHQAALLHKPESLIKLLLDRGADPNKQTLGGYTFIDLAFYLGHFITPLLSIALANPQLRSQYKRQTYLHLAVRAFDIEKVEILAMYINVNAKDLWGQTPLHLAVIELQLDIINKLIDYGADTNVRDIEGITPLAELFRALDPTNTVVPLDLVMLLAEGVDLDMKDIDGNTVLDIARKYQHYQAADLLLSLRKEGCAIVGVDYCSSNFREGAAQC